MASMKEDDLVFETYHHRSGKQFQCIYQSGMRFYLGENQEWLPFPKKWYSEGLLVTHVISKDDMKKGEQHAGVPCDICEEKSKKSACFCTDCNEFYCDDCKKVHQKSKATKNHIILSGKQMPTEKIARRENRFCKKHSDKAIEYHCTNHKDFLCTVCATVDHKDCNVEYIKDMAMNYTSSNEYAVLHRKIKSLSDLSEGKSKQLLSCKSTIDKCFENLKLDITEFRKGMMNKIDEMETEVLEEAEKIYNSDLKYVDAQLETCNSLTAYLSDLISEFKDLKSYKQEDQLVITASKSAKTLEKYTKVIEAINPNTYEFGMYELEITKQIEDALKPGQLFAHLSIGDKKVQSNTV